ncbi:heme ABC transporter ATP-binding protein [Natronosalvus rutilus]|uniref:Cobalamin import ATP-binding protein BtuD n=1 Tax=Natronosalvus rutilus TaxID=2953753 RepID=A0A9E7SVK4_9EURY|nr:heme ABC transporter ATP-binding protein [Natronosalvus rutilus]UTF53096.1 heme ABC transporter ATP-binding protein [Natronosalvus rutilus]
MTDAPARPLVEIEDLEVAYGTLEILEAVSLEVDRGEFVGLVGPNGAGKTTLLRALSGAITPAGGDVRIDGEDVVTLASREASRLVGVVPQNTSLSFAFDVRAVVEMGRYPHRSRFSPPAEEDRQQVDRALERTRTARFADRPIDAVSGGERQRVLIARALAQDTPLLLLDEPTASLDVNHQVETLELARELSADGRAVVAAIHDLDLAARYCDRLVVLAGGTVQADGPPGEVLTADVLESAFDANATVTRHPVTGAASVTAFPRSESGDRGTVDDQEIESTTPTRLEGRRVHVVGTGETAADVIARFERAGAEVTSGPAPAGGVVDQRAVDRGLECVRTEPFAPVSAAARKRVGELVGRADATVLADFELAPGTQLLIEALEAAPSLVALETRPLDDRNFVGEAGTDRYRRVEAGALEATEGSVLEVTARAIAVRDADVRETAFDDPSSDDD